MELRDYRPRQQVVLPQHSIERAAFPVVDAHTHLGRWLSSWVDRDGEWLVDDVAPWLNAMAERNVHAFVNLDGRWGDELAQNLERFDHAFPGRFATFAHLDWSLLAEQDGYSRLADHLHRSVAAGAAGLKVWKDLGLAVRDATGELVLPDHPGLDEMWQTAGELGIPVWWHVADPVAFFEPVDGFNENYEVLVARPDWSFDRPELPSFDRLIAALESVVARHPETVFVGVHGGCYAENLGWVDRMLSTYPNFNIDIAARLAQLGRQPRATRDLILRHPTRVLFGSDEIPHTGVSYPTHFRFLETADESFPHSTGEPPDLGRWMISGLHLPDDVLRAVYSENARRLLPRLASPLFPK